MCSSGPAKGMYQIRVSRRPRATSREGRATHRFSLDWLGEGVQRHVAVIGVRLGHAVERAGRRKGIRVGGRGGSPHGLGGEMQSHSRRASPPCEGAKDPASDSSAEPPPPSAATVGRAAALLRRPSAWQRLEPEALRSAVICWYMARTQAVRSCTEAHRIVSNFGYDSGIQTCV